MHSCADSNMFGLQRSVIHGRWSIGQSDQAAPHIEWPARPTGEGHMEIVAVERPENADV